MKYPNISLRYNRRKTATASKLATVEVMITHTGDKLYYNTGVRVNINQYSDGRIIRHHDASMLNKQIQDALNYVHKQIDKLWNDDRFSLQALQVIFNGSSQQENVADWLYRELDLRPLAIGTAKHHRTILKTVEDCGLFPTFKQFTVANLYAYDKYIRTNTATKTQASIYNYHKTLRPYVRKMYELGLISENPYDKVRFSRGTSNHRVFLSEEERSLVESIALPPRFDRVRDLFIFCCFTGLSYSDMAKITADDIYKRGNDYYISDKRTKTATNYTIKLLPQPLAILEKYNYVLPVITNQQANLALKSIQAIAGISKSLTMHVARHTFATWALHSGVPIHVVSKMLGHTDIKTTQIYARVLQDDVDAGYDLLKSKG